MSRDLSRDRIVATALEIVDQDGLKGLSMRKIAGRLGVEAMSLYRHVANKADLLEALHDRVVGSLEVPETGPWQERVRCVAERFRALMVAHPKLVPLLASTPATTPNALGVLERGVGVVREAGLTEEQAVIAFQTVFCFVIGHCVFHMADGTPPGPWGDAEFEGGLDVLIAGLEHRIQG